jgi:predicted NBD/HSP70 family sugar kinase
MLGIELLDAGAIAVNVDDNGTVRARSDAAESDLAVAALAALARLSAPANAPAGVASASPESAAAAAAMGALGKELQGRLARQTAMASGTAAAAAEAWIGAARGIGDVVYFSVADHTTAGILRQGTPMTGVNGRAASAGWLALNPVEREDYRKVGCVEAEVAASGIVRRLIWRIKAGDNSRVQDTVKGDLGAVTIEHVLSAARTGDGVAVSVVRDTAKYLGMAAANLVVIADPQMLVLGGIIASAADLLLEQVRSEIARRLPAAMMKSLTIAPATLGADAPAIGAARLSSTPSQ